MKWLGGRWNRFQIYPDTVEWCLVVYFSFAIDNVGAYISVRRVFGILTPKHSSDFYTRFRSHTVWVTPQQLISFLYVQQFPTKLPGSNTNWGMMLIKKIYKRDQKRPLSAKNQCLALSSEIAKQTHSHTHKNRHHSTT